MKFDGKSLLMGIGIHDSSASIVPYMKASKRKFLLISTGTWCISMNPFNSTPLTTEELNSDCLNYLSIDKQPIKSSMFFMGHIHDVNAERLTKWFNEEQSSTRDIKIDEKLLKEFLADKEQKRIFFINGVPKEYVDTSVDLSSFENLSRAYHRLVYDLTLITSRYIELIISPNDGVEQFFVSGGFARNEIFVRLLGSFFPDKIVFTSEIENSSALGAALVVSHALGENSNAEIDLNTRRWEPVK
jgi:sugar (pentulose or hexulose) kinase